MNCRMAYLTAFATVDIRSLTAAFRHVASMVCVLYANNALLVIDPCSAGSPANAVLITVSRDILQSGRIFVPVCDHICLLNQK